MIDFIRNFFDDFIRFHRWGNGKLLSLTQGLTDEACDASAPLGPGSLRATLVHLVGAQRIWLDRWQGRASGPFPTGDGWTISRIGEEVEAVDQELAEFVRNVPIDTFGRSIDYANLKGDRFQHRLSDLLLHVLNHAVHHRSQLLHFLKRQGRCLPGGLDYIFYKLAHPSILQSTAVAEACRSYGIEIGSVVEKLLIPDIDLIQRYQGYGDWALQRVLNEAQWLSDEQLDRDWSMGQGSLRKTLLHLCDAEIWWQSNWQGQPIPFPKSPIETTLEVYSKNWRSMAAERTRLVTQIGQSGLEKVVTADFGSGPLQFRIVESMIQLCVHGTLHRAQANNMLRSLGRAVQPLDYVVYIRDAASAS